MKDVDVIKEVEELDDDSLIQLYNMVFEHLNYLKENLIDTSTIGEDDNHEE